jgi:hypothetical protein
LLAAVEVVVALDHVVVEVAQAEAMVVVLPVDLVLVGTQAIVELLDPLV